MPISASGPLSMSKGGYHPRHPAVHEVLAAHPELGKRLNALTSLQARLTSRWDGAVSSVEAARDVSLDAHAALAHARNARFEPTGANPKHIAAAEAEVAQAKAALEDAADSAAATTTASANTREAMNGATSALNRIATRKAKITRVEIGLPKGRLDDIIAARRNALTALKNRRHQIEAAPPTRAEAEASLILQASEMARGPIIVLNAKGASLALPEQFVSLNAGHDGALSGMIPIPHVAALFAWSNFDALVEHIKSTLDERYASIDVAFSRSDKRKALAVVDAEILTEERIEVEAILAAAAAGQDFGLRRDTSVWAILGIDPVPGIDEEWNDGLPGTALLN